MTEVEFKELVGKLTALTNEQLAQLNFEIVHVARLRTLDK